MANPRQPVDQTRQQKSGGSQVLVWMRDEFEALRRQVHALATSVAQQRSILADLTEDRVPDLNVSLAELESCAAALRHEAGKLQGLEKAMAERLTGIVADAVRPQLRAAVAARLPGLVSETIQPELKAALTEVRECAADLKDEYSRLRAMRDDLAATIPSLVQAAIEKALGSTAGGPDGSRLAAPGAPSAGAPSAAGPSGGSLPADGPAASASPSPGGSGSPAVSSPAGPVPSGSVPAGSVRAGSDGGATNVGTSAPGPTSAASGPATATDPAHAPVTGAAAQPAVVAGGGSVQTLVEGDPAPLPVSAPVAATTAATTPPTSAAVSGNNGDHAASDPAEDDVTCVMPGMVVGPTLAAGITTALGRARLRRRRRRRAAAPAPGLHRRDPFAGHVTRRLERFARGRASGTGPRTGVSEGRMGEGAWATVAVGARDGEEIGVDLSQGSGLVISGPGAADSARAVVANLLSSRGPDDGAAIVVGDLLPAVPPFPGLAQASELSAVIDELTVEVNRRAKLLAEEGVPDAGAYRSRHPDESLPLLVLAAPVPGPDEVARLQTLAGEGARVGVNLVLVGGELAGSIALTLDAEGRVVGPLSDTPAGRLAATRVFSLDTQTAAELLAVLASARTDGEHMRPVVDDNQAFRPGPPSPEARVRVDLVGPYRIEVDGTEIRSGLRAKARELLAFYLLHPEGATLDEATEALWPEADPRRGSEWFWTALGNLRTRVRQATGQKELKVIDRDGDLYRVEDIFDVDLWRLERALYEGVHGSDDAVRGAAFDQAAVAYTGELLAGVDWFWLETPREDLRERVVDVLVWLGDRRWAGADIEGAALALKQALDVDPFAEQVYRRVMRLQARIGRHDEVDGVYRVLGTSLSEVGLEPTAETQKLYAELRPST